MHEITKFSDVNGKQTFFGRETFTLLYDEEGWSFRVDESELDTSKPPEIY